MLPTTPSILTVNFQSELNIHGLVLKGANPLIETEFKNAAWYYPKPLEKATNIKDHVAFCEFYLCHSLSSFQAYV
jgi:hypothetical protein